MSVCDTSLGPRKVVGESQMPAVPQYIYLQLLGIPQNRLGLRAAWQSIACLHRDLQPSCTICGVLSPE